MKVRWILAMVLSSMCALVLWTGMGNASEPCRVAKGDSPVAKACAEGGVVSAKRMMRTLVKQWRAAGASQQCDSCHTNEDRYDQLTPDAKQKFVKLLATIQKS